MASTSFESMPHILFRHLRQFSEFLLCSNDYHHFLLSFDLYELFLILFPGYASEVAITGIFCNLSFR